jgi:hypothetical protein
LEFEFVFTGNFMTIEEKLLNIGTEMRPYWVRASHVKAVHLERGSILARGHWADGSELPMTMDMAQRLLERIAEEPPKSLQAIADSLNAS